jgi:hypothetical protein
MDSEMLTRLAKQLNVSEPANVNPAYFLVLEAFENLVNLLDSASLNGMCVIVNKLYNRFVTELLWRNDERCRWSARLLVSQFLHNKLTN